MTREEAMEALSVLKIYDAQWLREAVDMAIEALSEDKRTIKRTGTHACDCISRQAAIEALNGLIDRFEQILRDIRETNVDDSVCGMCEYDGAYIGQSGDWCNECPGFDKDDCFKLSDECRKRWEKSVDLLSAQPFTSEQIQTMQELEAAQVEKAYELGMADRPTGHWIENDNGTFSCSNCQSWIPEEQHHYARHCLYCGARMESDEE